MFSEEKTAQIAAYFLLRRGGQMSYLKLMKLLYLADRESMSRYDEPMTGDSWVSMSKGPVLSTVLELLQGGSRTGVWEQWVAQAQTQHEVFLARQVLNEEDDFDELSPADQDILEAVWSAHGHKNRWQLVEYTHTHCAEWHDPFGSARPISPQSVFMALGRNEEEANELAKEIFQKRQQQEFLARMR